LRDNRVDTIFRAGHQPCSFFGEMISLPLLRL
jgi:hypothetical protein